MNEKYKNDYVRNPADPQGPMISREHAAQIGSGMINAAANLVKGKSIDNEPYTGQLGEETHDGLITSVPGVSDATEKSEIDELGLAPPAEELRVPDSEKWVPPTR